MSALFSPGFLIPLGTIICVYALAAAGLQLNIGQTGLLNFGQVGFMAIGAYTMAITVVQLHWPLPLGVLAGIALACLAAVGLGFSTLRLRSDYFAIATVAFAEIVRSTAANWSDVTGGMQGLSGFETSLGSLSVRFLEETHLKAAYYGIPLLVISVILLVIALVALQLLAQSDWGRTLRAIREDEDGVRSIGKPVLRYKIQSLVIAAGLGALAGCILALDLTIVSPNAFEMTVSFFALAIVVIGGFGSYRGVALGSVVFWFIFDGARFLGLPLSDDAMSAVRFLIVGVALILVVFLRPQGVFGKREEMVIHD